MRVLSDITNQHVNEISNHIADEYETSDEESGTNSLIFDSFYNEGDNDAIKSMTNFTPLELTDIWMAISTFVLANWNTERGRKTSLTGKDVLFMMLPVLKHGQQWDFTARLFGIKSSTFERVVAVFMKTISDHFYENCVQRVKEKWTMSRCRAESKLFHNFDYARNATHVTFQQGNRPSGNISERKKYFSGKHKLYGFKVEVSVLPSGLAIGCTAHYPGSVADLEIFRKNKNFHEEASKKVIQDLGYSDSGKLQEYSSDYWAILVDKGYQGAAEDLRAIHPTRTFARGALTAIEIQENREISSDRAIVENYFGRMTSLFTVLSHKYLWNEPLYDHIFKICLSLTNCHIKHYPLRDSDNQHFTGVRNRLRAISAQQAQKRRITHERAAERRRVRMRNMESSFLFDESD